MEYQTIIGVFAILCAPPLILELWEHFNPVKKYVPKTDLRMVMDKIRLKQMQKKLKVKRNIELFTQA